MVPRGPKRPYKAPKMASETDFGLILVDIFLLMVVVLLLFGVFGGGFRLEPTVEQGQDQTQGAAKDAESQSTEQNNAKPTYPLPPGLGVHGGPDVGGIDVVPWNNRLYNKHHRMPNQLPVKPMRNWKGKGKKQTMVPPCRRSCRILTRSCMRVCRCVSIHR